MNLKKSFLFIAIAIMGMIIIFAFTLIPTISIADNPKIEIDKGTITTVSGEETLRTDGCAFQTVMGNEKVDSNFIYKTPENILASIEEGLEWLSKAQHTSGGWGAGSHSRQHVMDPHAVPADPATTSMVAMAILRTGNDLQTGQYSTHLNRALEYLLTAVENTPGSNSNITTETGTQIQSKLGSNIDVVMTAQFLGNIIDHAQHNTALESRIKVNLASCTERIQNAQDTDGSVRGDGWAGVLQSGFANSAVETAKVKGVQIDEDKFAASKEYQIQNYDTETKNVKTDRGAGIVLYSISGSNRASAKDARKVKEEVAQAIDEGILEEAEMEYLPGALEKIGYTEDEAAKLSTTYQVYNESKNIAREDNVISGFGNNGGEEFLSFLQTGESLIINKDEEWKDWYDNTSGRILKIQNNDGSWNGHHCITSPVFCTATCLLILSINNDMEELLALGQNN